MIRWITCFLFHREWHYRDSFNKFKGTCTKCGREWN